MDGPPRRISSRTVLSGITGGGGGGDGDGERAGLAGLVERGLADDEAGFADDGGGAEGGGTLEAAASWDGAGDGECTTTGMEIGTVEGPTSF